MSKLITTHFRNMEHILNAYMNWMNQCQLLKTVTWQLPHLTTRKLIFKIITTQSLSWQNHHVMIHLYTIYLVPYWVTFLSSFGRFDPFLYWLRFSVAGSTIPQAIKRANASWLWFLSTEASMTEVVYTHMPTWCVPNVTWCHNCARAGTTVLMQIW